MRQQFGQLRRKGLLKADIAPPRHLQIAPQDLLGQCLEHLGWRGLVHKVKSGLPGLGHDGFHAVHQRGGRRSLVAGYVVQAHIAKTAFFPVAALGHGQLVPAPVAPQAVHGVEHVQQREVFVERQAVPGGRAHGLEGHIGLGPVFVLDLAAGSVSHKGAHQAACRALAAQVFQERQQGPLARVQRHKVHIVKQPGLGHLAQLGVDIAATERDFDMGVVGAHGLRNAQRGVHGAGKRHGQEQQLRGVLGCSSKRQIAQHIVNQIGRRSKGCGQWFKTGLATSQAFGIAHKLKARVNGVAQHVGQVVQVQRGQMARAVLLAQRAKGPGQRVGSLRIAIDIKRGKTWPFGQKAAPCNAVAERGVAPL